MEKPSDLQVVRDHEAPTKGWVEPVVALLMALTTVGTAWCSYQSAAWTREAAELNSKAASNLEKARSAGNVSGEYLANTVLFATVLFFASASGKFDQRRVRMIAFAFAAAVFAFALVRAAMLPS